MRKLALLLLFSTALFFAIGQSGSLDSSFGNNGIQTTAFPGPTYFTSTALQDNKIIAAGYAYNSVAQSSDYALARFKSNGSLDSSFGVNGKVVGPAGQGNSIALKGDKIIVAGYTISTTIDYALVRYTADGRLDSSFGVNGKVPIEFGINTIALQGDKIIAAGDFAFARFTADGRLDSSFGVNGGVATYFHINAIAFQGDKIVVAGSTYFSGIYDFALARYTANGILDSSFGVNGIVTTDLFDNSDDLIYSMVLQGNKIIVAGSTSLFVSHEEDFALARYTADGTLDSSFGVNGRVMGALGHATSIVLQGDKILAAGWTYDVFNNISSSALVRYTADGALDPSFGVNGQGHLVGNSRFEALALHDNRLYAVGSLGGKAGEFNGLVAAYQLEGTVPPEPTICIDDVTVCESQKQAVVAVHLSAPSTQVVKVSYTTRNKTAVCPQDYHSVSGTLQFALGTTTATIKIPIVNDSISEPTEQFGLRLSNACSATLRDSISIVTIQDDDTLVISQNPSLHLTAGPNPFADAFTFQLQGSTTLSATIRVYNLNGRLIEQRDHLSTGQSLRLGSQYNPGTYIIEVVQGNQRVQTKVVKTGK